MPPVVSQQIQLSGFSVMLYILRPTTEIYERNSFQQKPSWKALSNITLAEACFPHTCNGLRPRTEKKTEPAFRHRFRIFLEQLWGKNSKHDSQFEPGASWICSRDATLRPSVVRYSWRSNKRGKIKPIPGPNTTHVATLLPPQVLQSTFDSRTPSFTGVGLRSPCPSRPITRRMGAGRGS